MSVVDDIEFLEVADDRSTGSVETVATSRSPMARFWPLLAVVCAMAWFVGSTVGGDYDGLDAQRLKDSLLPPVAPISGSVREGLGIDPDPVDVTDEEVGTAEPARWPSPPLDRDPYVVRIPGTVEAPLGTLDRTLVYVNTLGDPTVVSFATGDVYEVDVAAIRVHETFAVEAGEVRSLEGANPGLADATDNAVVFHTYRDVDSPGVGSMGDLRGVGRGPELCLSDVSCSAADQGLARRVVGGVEVSRFDPADHGDVATILETWQPVDRWLVAADGYRIPVPAAVVWVITPRMAGGSWSIGIR